VAYITLRIGKGYWKIFPAHGTWSNWQQLLGDLVMTDKTLLKYRYSFSDFLFYIALLAIPVITAIVAILDKSIAGTVIFFLILMASIPIILRFFCTHCPHYCRDEKTLKCIFFWGLPKFFKQRPGSLSFTEKLISIAGPTMVLLYPVYWILQEPGLFIIYLLSVITLFASVRRNECPRCIYTECPVNISAQHTED
jgi:hypothetical protein